MLKANVHHMSKVKLVVKNNPFAKNHYSSACEYTQFGVLDRFEGNLVVLLMEEIDQELIIEKEQLPSNSRESTWFLIQKYKDGSYNISIDQEKTEIEKSKSKELLRKLQQRN